MSTFPQPSEANTEIRQVGERILRIIHGAQPSTFNSEGFLPIDVILTALVESERLHVNRAIAWLYRLHYIDLQNITRSEELQQREAQTQAYANLVAESVMGALPPVKLTPAGDQHVHGIEPQPSGDSGPLASTGQSGNSSTGIVIFSIVVLVVVIVYSIWQESSSDKQTPPKPTSYPTVAHSECPPSASDGLQLQMTVYVCTRADPLNLREQPTMDSAVPFHGRLKYGTSLTLIEGPTCPDAYTWWKVRTLSGDEGWVRRRNDGDKRETDPRYICTTDELQ
jgi:hypothetical protein